MMISSRLNAYRKVFREMLFKTSGKSSFRSLNVHKKDLMVVSCRNFGSITDEAFKSSGSPGSEDFADAFSDKKKLTSNHFEIKNLSSKDASDLEKIYDESSDSYNKKKIAVAIQSRSVTTHIMLDSDVHKYFSQYGNVESIDTITTDVDLTELYSIFSKNSLSVQSCTVKSVTFADESTAHKVKRLIEHPIDQYDCIVGNLSRTTGVEGKLKLEMVPWSTMQKFTNSDSLSKSAILFDLPYSLSDDELVELFVFNGTVTDLEVIPYTRGQAFKAAKVTFSENEEAFSLRLRGSTRLKGYKAFILPDTLYPMYKLAQERKELETESFRRIQRSKDLRMQHLTPPQWHKNETMHYQLRERFYNSEKFLHMKKHFSHSHLASVTDPKRKHYFDKSKETKIFNKITVYWKLIDIHEANTNWGADPLHQPEQLKVVMIADISKVNFSRDDFEIFKAMVGPRLLDDHHVKIVSYKYPCRMMNQKHCAVQLQNALRYSFFPGKFDADYESTMEGNVEPTWFVPPKSDGIAKKDKNTDQLDEESSKVNVSKVFDRIFDDAEEEEEDNDGDDWSDEDILSDDESELTAEEWEAITSDTPNNNNNK